MPKTNGKGSKKNNRTVALDVTLSDFADSPARTGRLRKSVGTVLKQKEDDTLWFEKDLEDFEFSKDTNESQKKPSRSKVKPEELDKRPGNVYPIDVWFLISGFVRPEDVKIFASICKDSYLVSRTYSFWIKMYKRFYEPQHHLPQRLQPECIEGSFCLKMHVVRALFHMYPLFTGPLSGHVPSSDVHSLSNLCCTSMWRIQKNGKWIFHFKFQILSSDPLTPVSYGNEIQDLWLSQDYNRQNCEKYVNHNPYEGSKILKVSCSHFVAIPPWVMGSRLSDVRINLAHDMRRQKLQLTFCFSTYCQATKNPASRGSGVYGDVVELDSVENIAILNWWHPQYPVDLKSLIFFAGVQNRGTLAALKICCYCKLFSILNTLVYMLLYLV
ncbi:putative transmembrane protein 183BP [Uloborus diversus]|uniref:putative transmembrane protein 183BP n=1 Tax=Uloborus diversus TaxID=327109 RepID=UPI00240A71D7|nr:putative transmembrane protein 183BP [Uloborus diversus]